jgi:hypothetical protein
MNKNVSNKKGSSKIATAVPNPDKDSSANAVSHPEVDSPILKKNFNRENAKDVFANEVIFKRNMQIDDVKTEFFILEGEDYFFERSLRGIMTKIIRKSSKEVKEWFYKKGINNELSDTYEGFKQQMTEFITMDSLEDFKKFSEEKWSSYLTRIQEYSNLRKIEEAQIFRCIRSRNLPKSMQSLFYNTNTDLQSVIEMVKEIEQFNSKQHQNSKPRRTFRNHKQPYMSQKPTNNNTNATKQNIQCFNCKEIGHYSYNCPSKKQLNINNMHRSGFKILDFQEIEINGNVAKVIFDTGSVASFLCSSMLYLINGLEINPETHNFTAIDGHTIKTSGFVIAEIFYMGKKIKEKIYIVKNDKSNDIIIGNSCIQRLKTKEKIPIICEINTKTTSPISWSRPIRNAQDRIDFRILLQKLIDNDIVEPSKSLWLNPVVLTRKKDGTLRFCVDFRKLNNNVDSDGFEIPRIHDLISRLHGMAYFGLIDLKDAFYQIELKECDREKTCFFDGTRLMQFKKMPQGFKNSPAIFQRAMHHILGDFINKICLVYIDDILVFGKTKDEQIENYNTIYDILNKFNLEINKEKTIKCVERINFLGFRISKNTIYPNLDRSQGIQDYLAPKNKKQLQRFLGMLNYDRIFIRKISDILKPLYLLLQNDIKFNWGEEQENAFKAIKAEYKKNLYAYIPDMKRSFELETDASDRGIGGVLLQDKKPVAFVSRSLSKAEQNYGITDREFLAIVWCIEKLEYYLIGKHFKIYTDHEAIKYIKDKANFGSNRAQRWWERLKRFDFDIEYIKGSENIISDALSRSVEKQIKNIASLDSDKVIDSEKIMKIHKKMNHRKNIEKDLKQLGIEVTRESLKKILQDCIVCAQNDVKNNISCEFIKTNKPGERIGVDFLEMNPRCRILLGIDFFTRKIFAQCFKTKEGENVIKFLNKIYEKLPFQTLQSDNGKEFINKEVEQWCVQRNVEHHQTVPYYHQGNGRVERANRTIREALTKTSKPIGVCLQEVIDRYNRTIHRGLGISPNDACKEENYNKIKEHEKKYELEFKRKNRKREILEENQKILIKNEFRKKKGDKRFFEKGTIARHLYGEVYEVKNNKGVFVKKHISQLKRI